MTRQQLRDRILTALNESTTSPVFWTTAQLDAVIDEASEVLAEEAKAIRRTAYMARQSGWTYYHLRGAAPDVMAIYRVWLPDLDKRLIATSMQELDANHRTWPTTTGEPEYWFPISWDCFGIYPHPAAGSGLLRIDYIAWPRALLDDNDEPEFREADQDALVLYGIYDALMKQWNAPRALEIFSRFMDHWQDGRARNGVREQQSRNYQRPMVPGAPFRSGVVR